MGSAGDGQFRFPYGVATLGGGRLAVADSGNGRALVVSFTA